MIIDSVLAYPMFPGSFGSNSWDLYRYDQLSLNSSFIDENKISKMDFMVKDILLVSDHAFEQKLIQINKPKRLHIKGYSEEITILSDFHIEPGRYEKLRIYIVPEKSSFVYSDKSREIIQGHSMIDFDIENGLSIHSAEIINLKLQFNLAKFEKVKRKRFPIKV